MAEKDVKKKSNRKIKTLYGFPPRLMKKKHKIQALGTGEMGHQLEALAVLVEY